MSQLASFKGVAYIIIIALFVLFIRSSMSGYPDIDIFSKTAEQNNAGTLLSLALLAACLLTVFTSTGASLHFNLAEMNFLFSAPISRAVLVVNKMLSYTAGAILSSLLLVFLIPPLGVNRIVTFLGMVLTLLFVQLMSAAISMGSLLLKKRWPLLPGRKALLMGWLPIIVIATLVFVTQRSTSTAGLHGGFDDLFASLTNFVDRSLPVQVLIAPFSLFSDLYLLTETSGMYLFRIIKAVVVLIGLMTLIVYFDRHLQDESSDSSLAAHRRWQTILKTGSVWHRASQDIRSQTVPRYFGGSATIAWTQCLRLFRNAPALAYGLPCIALLTGLGVGAIGGSDLLRSLTPILFFLSVFMLPKMLAYDFRGAPNIIKKLQTLPLSPWAICVGQLATPVLFSSVLHWLLLIGILPFTEMPIRLVLIAFAVVTVPFNVLLYATENTGFLLAPVRLVPVGRVDFDFLGRTLIDFLLKCLVLGAASILMLMTGWLVWSILPESLLTAALIMLIVLAFETILSLGAVTLAYRRFDITRLSRSD
jgi:hypothetical protein